jgi:hypothetical protein
MKSMEVISTKVRITFEGRKGRRAMFGETLGEPSGISKY